MTAWIATRQIAKDEPNNTLGRAVDPGEVFSEFNGPTYGCCDTGNAVVLGTVANQFFELPRTAMQVVT
jgi:hypothetical protein